MEMRSSKFLLGVGAIIALIFGLWYGWTRCLDTVSNRRRVSAEVRALVEASKRNVHDRKIVVNLLARARSNYKFEATNATVGLGEVGDAASPFILDIASLMGSEDATVRQEAANSLGKLGRRSEPALELLVAEVSKTPSDATSWFAADAIGKIGEPATKYIPLLRSRLGSGGALFDESLRNAIAILEALPDTKDSQGDKQ